MEKQQIRTYRWIAYSLVVLMTTTSLGYAVDLHFCSGTLKNFSFLGKAKNCHQKMQYCPHHGSMMVMDTDKGCCDNEVVIIDNLDVDYLSATSFVYDVAITYVLPPFSPDESPVSGTTSGDLITEYLHFKPPLPAKSRAILFQSFLF